ncbi:uncharacterized protein PV09_04282 [Verruconis gallopava]|uniref:DUF8032 domain-containing protein n=1 Tax=Verruconis gallopava TaxID=253628 RepID=A0A0D2ACE8_9PEZI|nr:uncharacterized protein PV09_04282 [Verruconis gallopava]KIW04528.1 hypothetical protein PV09_04282 [Verruconis gallopava]
MHHPHHGLPPPQHLQHPRSGVIQHQPGSPHQSQTGHQGHYPSPHIPSHSLPPQHQSPYVQALPGQPGQNQPEVPYYTHPSPYSSNSAASGNYSSSEQIDPMATAAMNRYPLPNVGSYHTPQSASPASVQSPQHDPSGRPLYSHPQQMYPPYQQYAVQQPSPYAHPGAPQPGPMNTGFMSQPGPGSALQHTSHPVTSAMTGSPGNKMPQSQMQRPGPGMSPASAPQGGPPPGMHQGPSGGSSGINPNAAPGPIPATTPLVVRQDQNGVQWIAFEYSRDRVKMEYTIRCDVESVNTDTLPQEFKTENCVYPRACCPKDQYKGNRLHYETECNTVGWALAHLNPCLRGKRGLIQRAVDSWRNSNSDPRLRSRRVRRMAKINSRKSMSTAPGAHMAGPAGPGPAGMPPSGLAAPGPRQPAMGMGGQHIIHHHDQAGGPHGGADDVSASNDYNDGSVTHHHHAPTGASNAPTEVRQANNFYPTYPSSQSMVNAGLPAPGDGMEHLAHAPVHAATTSATTKDDEEVDTVALFGDLPEAKRRKFILVDDAQRGTRVRVRVMLDQVRMHEMPDSYRKNNSVYPRSWYPTEMQSPPPSPRRGRWPDDVDADQEGTPAARTLVHVPLLDGSDAKLPVPRMSKAKRNKEVTLNDLGYRMSWSQSRVFSGRTLFLQRSLDAYRNKMRSTMVAAGQDVTTIAPHFETRVGKRKWIERSKRAKREASP